MSVTRRYAPGFIAAATLIAACALARPAAATVLFTDTFQGNLSKWTNPASAGEIVAAPGGGNALTFGLLQGGSNLLTTTTGPFTSSTGSFTLSFNIYANCGFTSGCGAFFAVNGANWFLSDTVFGSDTVFADAPGWETVSYTFAGTTLSNLAMEDYSGSPHSHAYPNSGAIYITDLSLTNDPIGTPNGTLTVSSSPVPEPASLALLGLGLLGLSALRRQRA